MRTRSSQGSIAKPETVLTALVGADVGTVPRACFGGRVGVGAEVCAKATPNPGQFIRRELSQRLLLQCEFSHGTFHGVSALLVQTNCSDQQTGGWNRHNFVLKIEIGA